MSKSMDNIPEKDLIKLNNLLNTRVFEDFSDDLNDRILFEAEKIQQKRYSYVVLTWQRPLVKFATLSVCAFSLGISLAIFYSSTVEKDSTFFIADKLLLENPFAYNDSLDGDGF